MGLATLEGKYDGGGSRACLVDATTGEAFGPLFDDGEQIESFLGWLGRRGLETDPRRYHPVVLTAWVNHFRGHSTLDEVRMAIAATGNADGLRPSGPFGRRGP